jgi:integrase/recombinase XerD
MQQVELVDARTNPTKAVKPVKAPTTVDVFTDQQIREMLGYFGRIKGRDKTLYAYRDYAMVVVLLGTGMRLGELVNLRWDDVDFLNKVITVIGKKRQQSSIPMTAKLRKELSEYRVFVDETFKRRPEFVFTDRTGAGMTDNGVKCIFKRLKEVMNFDGVRLSPHTFRHTFASRMVKAGADAFTVQKMLRHTALAMTMRYVNLFGTALKEQNDKYNPLNGVEL